jgi:hypothetical protein
MSKTEQQVFSPTMREAIDRALKHGEGVPGNTVLVRFPGGFWSHRDWQMHQGAWFGTSTINAIVKRGAGEYSAWKERKDGSKFPIEVRITL